MNSNTKWIVVALAIIIVAGLAWYMSNSTPTPPAVEPPSTPEANIPPATSESPALINTIWVANTLNDNPVTPPASLTLQFDDQNTLSGSDGCNSFSTSYTITDTTMTIDPAMASTMMACDEAVMAQASSFTQTLLATTSYQLGDGVLVLLQDGTAGITLSGQSNSLSKTSWNITSFNNGNQAVVGIVADTTPSITFGDDGTVSGSTGCNNFSGEYSLNGSTITISPLATTKRACIEPEGISEQEQGILSALESATTWSIQGSNLSLRTAEDALAIVATNTLTTNP